MPIRFNFAAVLAAMVLAPVAQSQSIFIPEPLRPRRPLLEAAKFVFDPRNGYVDFLRAADLVHLTPAPSIDAFSDAQAVNSKSRLDLAKDVVREYGAVIPAIRKGLYKEIWETRGDQGFEALFPELAVFKKIARVYAAQYYVAQADGNSRLASDTLCEAIQFSMAFDVSTLIHHLVAHACQAILLASIDQSTLLLSLPDIQRVDRIVSQSLDTERIISVLNFEHAVVIEYMRSGAKDLEALFGGSPEAGTYDEAFRNLSTEEKREIALRAITIYERSHGKVIAHFRQPESTWLTPIEDPEPKSIEEWLASVIGLVPMSLASTEVRIRTQLRLFRLHLAISAFRWNHGRLPDGLKQLERPELLEDPLSNEGFQYMRTAPMSYRVWSKGTETLGEIEMRYRPPQRLDDRSNEPPLFAQLVLSSPMTR